MRLNADLAQCSHRAGSFRLWAASRTVEQRPRGLGIANARSLYWSPPWPIVPLEAGRYGLSASARISSSRVRAACGSRALSSLTKSTPAIPQTSSATAQHPVRVPLSQASIAEAGMLRWARNAKSRSADGEMLCNRMVTVRHRARWVAARA